MTRARVAALAVVAMAAGLVPAGTFVSRAEAAPPKAVVVTPTDLGEWQVQHETCGADEPTGTAGFVEGPDRPPLGAGSLRLAVGRDGASRPEALLPALAGVPLAELTELSYSTLVLDESPAPHLELVTDAGVLRYDPAGSSPNRWLRWAARAGRWLAGGDPVTLDEFVADNPDAVVVEPGLRVAAGCDAARPDVAGHVDDVAVGIAGDEPVHYDFEPEFLVLSVDDLTTGEGDERPQATVSLSSASAEPVTVVVTSSAGGTATEGADFEAAADELYFEPGTRSVTFDLIIADDAVDENDETFTLSLSEPSDGVTISAGGGSATVTIVDNDAAPSLAAVATTVVEGAAGSALAEVAFAQTGLSERTIGFDFETRNGTANASDYQPSSGRLTVNPGETPVVRIPVLADQVQEATEAFSVVLSNPTNVTLASNATVTILDDDAGAPAAVRVADLVAAEGRNAVVRLTRTGDTTRTASVTVATADGGANPATQGVDYTAVTRTVTFEAGATHASASVPVAEDGVAESLETFLVNLTNPIESVLADNQAVVSIVPAGDPSGPTSWLAAADTYLLVEGDARRTTLRFEIYRTGALDQPATVDYATNQLSAIQGSDYIPVSGTLTFEPGQSFATVDVAIVGDDTPEAVETFELLLSNAAGAVVADRAGLATIADDDIDPAAGPPGLPASLVIDDAVVTEGDTGVSHAVFTVRRLGDTAASAGFRYSTGPGIRPAASPTDYTAVPSTPVTMAAGQTEATFAVPVTGDTRDEKNERFVVYLTNPSRAVLADSVGVATIIDDDGPPAPAPTAFLAVRDALPGPEGGTHTFTVTRRGDTTGTTVVKVSTASGTARSSIDFTPATDTLTFDPGEAHKAFTVHGIGDTLTETHETLTVRLTSATGAAVEDSRATAILLDDDPGLTLTAPSAHTAPETDNPSHATIDIDLSQRTSRPVTVAYRTATAGEGLTLTQPAATPDVDYTATQGTLTFNPGELTRTITIPITGDNLAEHPTEQFAIELTDPTGAHLTHRWILIDLVDDDVVHIEADDPAARVEDAGPATINVRLSGPASHTITLGYATENGTAVAGADYTTTTGILSFAPGTTEHTITVPVTPDDTYEAAEAFTVRFHSPSGAALATGTVTVALIDDDALPSVSVNEASASESDGTIIVPVELSEASGVDTVVDAFLVEASASATDFDRTDRRVTIPAGSMRSTIAVPITDSYGCEGDQYFEVDILATNATVAPGEGTAPATIRDVDCGGLTAHDAVITEGTASPTVRITLDQPGPNRVRVDWRTEPVPGPTDESLVSAGGKASVPGDVAQVTGTVDIPAGGRSVSVALPLADDETCEQPERFRLVLAGATNATIGRGAATVTIADDDCAGAVVWDASTTEGAPAIFRLALPTVPAHEISFTVNTASGTAESDWPHHDFTDLSAEPVTVPRGHRVHTIDVGTTLTGECEHDEMFNLSVAAGQGSGVVSRATGTGVIHDTSGPCFTMSPPADAVEGTDAVFEVVAVPTPRAPVELRYSTLDGDALGTPARNHDYVTPAAGASIVFAPGQSTGRIRIPTVNREHCQGPEGFFIDIAPSHGRKSGYYPALRIVDEPGECADSGPDVISYHWTNHGGKVVSIVIRIPSPAAYDQDFHMRTEDGTAIAHRDYLPFDSTWTIPAGSDEVIHTIAPKCSDARPQFSVVVTGVAKMQDAVTDIRLPACT